MCGKVKIRFGAGFTLSLKGEGFGDLCSPLRERDLRKKRCNEKRRANYHLFSLTKSGPGYCNDILGEIFYFITSINNQSGNSI